MREDLIERLNDAWRRLYADGDEHGVCDMIAEAAAALEALRAERDLFRDETIELVRQNGEWQARLEAAREDAWQPIEFEPPHNRKKDSLGTEYLIHPPTSGGDRTAFYGRRLGGAACWYRYGAPVRGVTHWRPLPAPPAIDQARGKGVKDES